MKTSLSLLAVLLLGTVVLVDHAADGNRPTAAASATAPLPVAVEPVRPTPHQQEIRAVVDSARVAEARLRADLGDAASPDHPLLREHRRATTLRLLEIQARHAAARGRHDLERRIRANLAVLRDRTAAPALAARVD
jgi:hypothetical protein